MKKVYTVKIDLDGRNMYLHPKSRLGMFHYSGQFEYKLTNDISEAKHYEKESIAKAMVKNFHRTVQKLIDERNDSLKDNSGMAAWYRDRIMRELESLQKFQKSHSNLSVVAYEVESLDESNIKRIDAKRLKWITTYNGKPYRGKYEVITETGNRHHCKLCGLKLKNIPQVKIISIYGGVICAKCAIAMGEKAKRAWEAIPKEERDIMDKEIFLHNLE